MEPTNQIGIYQLENLILQRVNFTLVDMTQQFQLIEMFGHLNPYYLNFLKSQISKLQPAEYKSLAKESPIIAICDTGKDSLALITELETDGFINAFYVLGGAQNLIDHSKHN
ncbi:MAG: rhodanese-like domain-containing protein [Bdellovibrionaceae bacterium]|nr:rhodanese-like domain-containing protein [Pseudobdellovibrionaceae bacterium]